MTTAAILGIMGLGGAEILLIGAILLLMFGGRKIPELMRGLGKGVKEYKDASNGNTAPVADEVPSDISPRDMK